jgi:fermentation-respiration switch protein FrsA (DUF1100 family)
MKNLRRLLAISGCAYLAAAALLVAFQRELIYAPDRIEYLPPSHYATLAGVLEVDLETVDGFDLKAWYAPAPVGRPTVVMFPGKSGSLRSQRYRVQHFRDAEMGVLLLAYRGYSGNDGEPSEEGLYRDARAALDWLRSAGVEDASIVLYGASLGSGVATEMAAEGEYGAVVLEAPYTSVVDVAASRFPIVPVRWLMTDRFDSLSRIDALHEPLLVMHGDSDRVIPQRYGRQLFDAADAPKVGFWPQGVGHNDLFDRGGFDAALDFIEQSMALAG